MKPIYGKLYDYYCEPILRERENFDAPELEKQLASLGISEDRRRKLLDIFCDYYFQWSTDAFAIGLHLGLSLR